MPKLTWSDTPAYAMRLKLRGLSPATIARPMTGHNRIRLIVIMSGRVKIPSGFSGDDMSFRNDHQWKDFSGRWSTGWATYSKILEPKMETWMELITTTELDAIEAERKSATVKSSDRHYSDSPLEASRPPSG